MTLIARQIDPTNEPCAKCGTMLLITRDAIGRPRHRCPSCQGVVREPMEAGVVGHTHRQTAESPADLSWDAPVLERRRCVRCGSGLPTQRIGRPRTRCADLFACAARRERGV